MWCLTKSEEEKFRQALVNKEINPFEIADIGSEKRRALFEKFVAPENAAQINSYYESKLLQKNRLAGFKNWAERSIGRSPAAKRDLYSRIERFQERGVFDAKQYEEYKEDLARTGLGFNLTFEEAQNINLISEETAVTKGSWQEKLKSKPEWQFDPQGTRAEWIDNPERMKFGLNQAMIEKYVNEIKLNERRKNVSFKEDPIRAVFNPIKASPVFFNNLFKSLMASIDNSLWGRQTIKLLYGSMDQKRIWARNFRKSFGDIKDVLVNKKVDGFEPIDFIRADIYSRPNAMNGKYKAGGYELGVLTEEAFPTSLPARIPGLGRLFTASETAFNGGALRVRADLADMYIGIMEKQGLNPLNPDEARGVGHLVGAMTGRGSLGKLTTINQELNFVLWSARFFKANIDTLTAHQFFDGQATSFSKREARKNLVSIVAHVGATMLFASLFLGPDAVEEDPRSTNFGKIKIFGYWVDITGGMRSIAIIAAKVVPTVNDGKLSYWRKSSTGNWTDLRSGQYGGSTVLTEVLDAVFLNKLAPVASTIRDYYKGQMFGGEPFNIKKSIINSTVPLSIQNMAEVKDEGAAVILGVMMSEFFGLGVSTYKYESYWESKNTDEMKNFQEQVGDQKFKDANNDFNRAYTIWFEETEKTEGYVALSNEEKKKLQIDGRKAIKDKILKEYGYKEVKKVKTREERLEAVKIKRLIK